MNTKYCLDSLKKYGAESAACVLTNGSKYEMNVDNGKMSLLRTTYDTNISLRAIIGNAEGSASLNMDDEQSIDEAAALACELAKAASPDEANGFAEAQPYEAFSAGPESPDAELMYARAEEFINDVKTRYPLISLRTLCMSHEFREGHVANTNGVEFDLKRGYYTISITVMARDGDLASSFNYTGYLAENLDTPIINSASIDTILRETSEQLRTNTVEGKFEGDVIFTPDCFDSILEAYVDTFLSDTPLISGTSPFKDSLGKPIASEILTVHSMPTSLPGGYSVTGDGYKAQDCDIIKSGTLANFTLGLYGSKKTGLPHANTAGSYYVVEPGNTSFEDMIKSVSRGLLVSRFSGGNPTKNGDLNGVAKNSYYIENGEIKYPVSETMISGNLNTMFNSISEISDRRVDFGYTILPHVKITNMTIIGK